MRLLKENSSTFLKIFGCNLVTKALGMSNIEPITGAYKHKKCNRLI